MSNLKTIIPIAGACILLQGIVGPLNEEQQKQLGMVRDSSHHLLNLINDVLDISKIEADQLQVTLEPFDMREAIEAGINMIDTAKLIGGMGACGLESRCCCRFLVDFNPSRIIVR